MFEKAATQQPREADPLANLKDSELGSELFTQIHNGTLTDELLQNFISRGVDLNTTYSYVSPYNTPLIVAVQEQNYTIAEMLLNRGANTNAPNGSSYHKKYPLQVAAEEESIEIAKLLVQHGADVSVGGEYERPIYLAGHKQNQGMVTLFIKHDTKKAISQKKTDWNKSGWHKKALEIAVRTNDLETVKLVLAAGFDVNTDSLDRPYAFPYTGLYQALTMTNPACKLEILDALIKAGANLKQHYDQNRTVVMEAATRGNLDQVMRFVEAGVELKSRCIYDEVNWPRPSQLKNLNTDVKVFLALAEALDDAAEEDLDKGLAFIIEEWKYTTGYSYPRVAALEALTKRFIKLYCPGVTIDYSQAKSVTAVDDMLKDCVAQYKKLSTVASEIVAQPVVSPVGSHATITSETVSDLKISREINSVKPQDLRLEALLFSQTRFESKEAAVEIYVRIVKKHNLASSLHDKSVTDAGFSTMALNLLTQANSIYPTRYSLDEENLEVFLNIMQNKNALLKMHDQKLIDAFKFQTEKVIESIRMTLMSLDDRKDKTVIKRIQSLLLFRAARLGNKQDVEKWEKEGALLNIASNDGNTALMVAVLSGDLATVEFLLPYKNLTWLGTTRASMLNMVNDEGDTALDIAKKMQNCVPDPSIQMVGVKHYEEIVAALEFVGATSAHAKSTDSDKVTAAKQLPRSAREINNAKKTFETKTAKIDEEFDDGLDRDMAAPAVEPSLENNVEQLSLEAEASDDTKHFGPETELEEPFESMPADDDIPDINNVWYAQTMSFTTKLRNKSEASRSEDWRIWHVDTSKSSRACRLS